ncbi:hypothetical protein M0813_25913 [Anaeramoeba flamelloides]|uniref:Uncharacterized protein n=1 Tax=Anaeramoeba flamelloides TaxID=1746091 RepID=A0ABQ8Y1F5_9EUKA|nr:hypothetical protein M0813_25913 [Anaeramoeba flamelloides]
MNTLNSVKQYLNHVSDFHTTQEQQIITKENNKQYSQDKLTEIEKEKEKGKGHQKNDLNGNDKQGFDTIRKIQQFQEKGRQSLFYENSSTQNRIIPELQPLTNEKHEMISRYMGITNSNITEAIIFLSLADWDFKLALGTQVLSKLNKKRKTNNNQLLRSRSALGNSLELQNERKRRTLELKSVSCPNVVKNFGLKNTKMYQQQKRLRRNKTKKHALTLREICGDSKITMEFMENFLNQKPAPRWNARLTAFYDYDNTILEGWPKCLRGFNAIDENGNQIRKLVISKRIFQIYRKCKKSISVKNLQRGLVTFLEKQNFINVAKYDDPIFLFISYEPVVF